MCKSIDQSLFFRFVMTIQFGLVIVCFAFSFIYLLGIFSGETCDLGMLGDPVPHHGEDPDGGVSVLSWNQNAMIIDYHIRLGIYHKKKRAG